MHPPDNDQTQSTPTPVVCILTFVAKAQTLLHVASPLAPSPHGSLPPNIDPHINSYPLDLRPRPHVSFTSIRPSLSQSGTHLSAGAAPKETSWLPAPFFHIRAVMATKVPSLPHADKNSEGQPSFQAPLFLQMLDTHELLSSLAPGTDRDQFSSPHKSTYDALFSS